jgi:hypothetical protein
MTAGTSRAGIADELRALIVRGAVAPGNTSAKHRLTEPFGRSVALATFRHSLFDLSPLRPGIAFTSGAIGQLRLTQV